MMNFSDFVKLYQAYEQYVTAQAAPAAPAAQAAPTAPTAPAAPTAPDDLAGQLAALQSTVDKIVNRPPQVDGQPKVQTIDDIILGLVK